MDVFGVRFRIADPERFQSLSRLYLEIQRDKQSGRFRESSDWLRLVPGDIKGLFSWPTPEERQRWVAIRHSTIIRIPNPSQQIGARWDFYRVFEAIEEGDYDVLGCEIISDDLAEMRIDPHAYPYGGVGPLIALAEAFGFTVIGVNEYGKFESRAELLGDHA